MADFSSGLSAGLEARRYNDDTDNRRIRNEQNQLGLDQARRMNADEQERRRIVEDATTEKVVKDFDASDNPQTVERVPKKLTLDDQLNLYEQLGQHDLKTGRADPEKAAKLREQIRSMDQEGEFDAYNEYKRTKDMKAAIKMFNKRGTKKIDENAPISEVQKVDPLTKMPYTAYQARGMGGEALTFDPLQTAREAGGAKGFLDQQRTAFDAQKADVAERRATALEQRETNRDEETRRRGVRDDRRYETDQRKLDILEQERARDRGASGGVFGYKMNWLKDNVPNLTPEQQYSLATGSRTIPEAQIRKWAEDAVGRAEKLTGIPMKAEERKRAIDEKASFLRGMRSQGDRPGLNPPAPQQPAAAPKDYSNLW